jgi:hypothetical protein
MNFRNLDMAGSLKALIQKLYFFFKKNSNSNSAGKQLKYAPVRVNNSMNLTRNMDNHNPTNR